MVAVSVNLTQLAPRAVLCEKREMTAMGRPGLKVTQANIFRYRSHICPWVRSTPGWVGLGKLSQKYHKKYSRL